MQLKAKLAKSATRTFFISLVNLKKKSNNFFNVEKE